ncbi:hypothetical protein KR044_010383, partial [Drosophila immigrans]
MALVAHRMMLPARHRRTQQQVARNKVGVLLVPSLADYYTKEGDQQQQPQQPQQQLQLQQVAPATSQLELQAGDSKVNKLAHIWYCLEPAAFEEVRSTYSPKNTTMERDYKKEEMDVSEIIKLAAVEHEAQKQQWFREVK